MSNDDWNPPPPGPPPSSDGDNSDDWYNNQLPPDGGSWDDVEQPRPLHEVRDEEWGTAPSAPPTSPPNTGGDWGQAPAAGPHGAPPTQPPRVTPQAIPEDVPAPVYGGPPNSAMMRRPQTNLQSSSTKLETDDAIAIALSIFIPGAGHIMLGQTTKGLVLLASIFFTCGVSYTIALLIALDAYMVAMAKKKRPVDDWEFFPK